MEEDEWLHSWDVRKLYDHIVHSLSDRKLRLFACASCRRYWAWITRERAREALVVAERYADEQATERELSNARSKAFQALADAGGITPTSGNPQFYNNLGTRLLLTAVAHTTESYRSILRFNTESLLGFSPDHLELAAMLRDVAGNPWQPPVIDTIWLAWNDSSIPRMADLIYAERAFDRFPILGDALEEAGCDNPVILDHCRKFGEHARGCWLLDALLGRS